jgi:rubrerythrin
MVQQLNRNASTGFSNEQYDLISALYHALESASTYETYIQDAQQSGNSELVEFFENVKSQNIETAKKAKELLSKHIS